MGKTPEIPTDDEREALIQQATAMVHAGFQAQAEAVFTQSDIVLAVLEMQVRAGDTLAQASRFLTERKMLDTVLVAVDQFEQNGRDDIAAIFMDAYTGGNYLIHLLGIAELKPASDESGKISRLYDNSIQRREETTGYRPSITEQTDEYLRTMNLFAEIERLYELDPSGYALIDHSIEQMGDPTSYLFSTIPVEWTQYFRAGLEETGNYYKRAYLLGAENNLGPMPKNQ